MPEEPTSGVLEDVHEQVEEELKEPTQYRVLIHNDHYTTMDFVIEVLMVVFHKTVIDATKIMLDVHRKGQGEVGVYTYDIALTRVMRVRKMAREREFPLKCTMEEV
ncbi:MAG: ATP-dependent Clp protease adaptor ClpS [Spirochaetaceae bacterium]|nr:MAG: ATP-dependent Clp protease adaptor ClpS [Spirochaetaceae bacterium]